MTFSFKVWRRRRKNGVSKGMLSKYHWKAAEAHMASFSLSLAFSPGHGLLEGWAPHSAGLQQIING